MIFHNRPSLEKYNLTKKNYRLSKIIFVVLLFTASINAGSYTRSLFNLENDGIQDSNVTAVNNGFGLDIKYYDAVKLFGDSLNNFMKSSYCDVVAGIADTFTYFYVDTVSKKIYNQQVRLNVASSTGPGLPAVFCDITPAKDCYLHADKSRNGFLVSFVQKSGTVKRLLRLHNGTQSLDIDSSVSKQWIFPTQCTMENDTFLVVNSTDMSQVTLRKVYSNNNALSVVDEVTVATDAGGIGTSLMNCSVHYDKNGTILVTWIRGSPVNSVKLIHYKFYNRSLQQLSSGIINQGVGDNNFYYYDDNTIVPLGIASFGVVFWDALGVMCHRLTLSGATVQASSQRVINRAGVKYCTAASNGKYFFVGTSGDVNADTKSGIEGYRYSNIGNLFSNPIFISFSDINTNVNISDEYSTTLNCSIDTVGSLGITWKNFNRVYGSAWATRGVRHQKGYWTSPVESLQISTGDSVRYFPAQVTISSLNSWFLEDSIRIGCTPEQCVSSPWISLSSSSILNQHRTGCNYFQYRIAINRRPLADSLNMPKVTAFALSWNTKPAIIAIDSIRNGSISTGPVPFGHTSLIMSRKDSLRVYVKMKDIDPGDNLTFSASAPVAQIPQLLSSGPLFSGMVLCLPLVKSDTTFICTLRVSDANGWQGIEKTLSIATRNSVPILNTQISYTHEQGIRDTVPFTANSKFMIQENDSVEFFYSISDTNDALISRGYVRRKLADNSIKIDSTVSNVVKKILIRGDTITPVDTVKIQLSATDPDTVIIVETQFRVNHSPRLVTCIINQDTLIEADTTRVNLSAENPLIISIDDPDCAFWDTLTLKFKTKNNTDSIKTVSTNIIYNYKPSFGDTLLDVVVYDRSGKKDSLRFYIKFPWLENDSSKNLPLIQAIDTLANHISLVIGSDYYDTVSLPLLNNGNDTMHITAIQFKNNSSNWLSVAVPYDTAFAVITSLNYYEFKPLLLIPDSVLSLKIFLSALKFQGDSILYDSVILTTSDPIHKILTVPVRMEYNDLPRIVSVAPYFLSDVPFQGLSKKRTYSAYRFPPHSKISVSFSEPMDSVPVLSGVRLYSVMDSMKTGVADPLQISYTWSQNYTKLNISPKYVKKSSYYNILPSEGIFIPTDSLAIVLTTAFIDRAKTPSGPNRLDINLDFKRDFVGDTIIPEKVDSITFSLIAVTPEPYDTLLGTRPQIELLFNSSVYAASVDSSLVNNRSLLITSKYNNGKQLSFDSIGINENRVTFRIARSLFYSDSLSCRFRGATIRDIMGFPSDNNDDGIADPMFDSSSSGDDVIWWYKVKPISIVSVAPAANIAVSSVSPPISILFSEPLRAGSYDLDTSVNNRSITVRSVYRSQNVSFRRIELSADSLTLTFYPSVTFFSNDTIRCEMHGFTKGFNYEKPLNLPDNSTEKFAGYQWRFFTGSIGFYTYPNPYKPGKDPRHCNSNGPCGIWFKNLHVLKTGNRSVKIKIYSINAYQIFDSDKAGISIIFETGISDRPPEWLWNTRNQRGEFVASGLYFYTIFDMNGELLKKGKLIIVR